MREAIVEGDDGREMERGMHGGGDERVVGEEETKVGMTETWNEGEGNGNDCRGK